MTNYKKDYEALLGYLQNYTHESDLPDQQALVDLYWDAHCVVPKTWVGIPYYKHHNAAKALWAKLDREIYLKRREL